MSVASDEVDQRVEVCHVDVNQSEVGVVHKRKEKLSGLLNFKHGCDAIEEQVLEDHDVFAIDEGEHGEVREVQHEIVTGDSPPIRQPVCRIPFALREVARSEAPKEAV